MVLFEFIERQWVQTDFSCLADNNNSVFDETYRDVGMSVIGVEYINASCVLFAFTIHHNAYDITKIRLFFDLDYYYVKYIINKL